MVYTMSGNESSDDESREHFHANWKALATAHFKHKVFVRSSGTEDDKTISSKPAAFPIIIDESASTAYNEILQMPSTAVQRQEGPKVSKTKIKQKRFKFNKDQLFRMAMADNGTGIQKLVANSINPDIDATDSFGWTALMMAACEGSGNAFYCLLDLGADYTVSDKKGNTAISLAKQKSHQHIAEAFEEFQQRNELIECDNGEDQQDDGTLFCKDCGIEIARSSSKSHETSTVHLFSCKFKGSTEIKSFGISRSNRGYQIMQRSGWDGNSALGAKSDGKLYPIKTVIRRKRTGLGVDQDTAKITHFKANDPNAVHFRPPPRNLTRKEIIENDLRDKRHDQRLRRELS